MIYDYELSPNVSLPTQLRQLVWFVACLPCLHEYFKCQLIGWYYSGDGQGGKLLMLNLLAKLQKVGNYYIP